MTSKNTSRTGTTAWKRFRAKVIYREQQRLGSKYLTCALCQRADLDPKAPPHTERSIEIDHKVSIANGGAVLPGVEGAQVLCHLCNRRKSNRDGWTPEGGNQRAEVKPDALRIGWFARHYDSDGKPLPVSQPWFGDERYWNGTEFIVAPDGGWPVGTFRPPDVA